MEADNILSEQTDYTPACSWGSAKRYIAHCRQLDASYIVDVLLPEDYDPNAAKRYPVVYMHDGQNLFDPFLSYGGVSWAVDKALKRLSQSEEFQVPIIVGIHNREELRSSDYLCQKVITDYIPADQLDKSGIMPVAGGRLHSDAYTTFLANDLKNAIDATFNTLPERENTFIMGSSMGGLASLYAICEYPDTYGGAACLSTHWIGNFDYNSSIFPTAMLAYMTDRLPSPETHKLYFDHGTTGLDSAYPEWNNKALKVAESKGYSRENGTLLSYIAEGADHNERYWAQRVNIPFQFMLEEGNTTYEPVLPETNRFHVVFCDPAVSWSSVSVFTWGGGVTQTGAWPGTAMTATTHDGKPAWEITFEHTTEPTNIIFNDITSTGIKQTADLDFVNNSVYDFSGVIGTLSGIEAIDNEEKQTVIMVDGNLHVFTTHACRLPLVRVDGTVKYISLHPGENIINELSEGVYIVNNRKLFLRNCF